MRKKPVPLSLCLNPECMKNLRDNFKSMKASNRNHRVSFARIRLETASNPEDSSPHTARPRLEDSFATAPHGSGLLLSLGHYQH